MVTKQPKEKLMKCSKNPVWLRMLYAFKDTRVEAAIAIQPAEWIA